MRENKADKAIMLLNRIAAYELRDLNDLIRQRNGKMGDARRVSKKKRSDLDKKS